MGKTGLIVEGGGMKCAYSAGILDRFLDDKITFDYCIGVSAGAANTLSYLAGQRGRNLRFYTVHLDDPRAFVVVAHGDHDEIAVSPFSDACHIVLTSLSLASFQLRPV